MQNELEALQNNNSEHPDDSPYETIPAIRKSTLVDEVCQFLRSAIYGFILKPGQAINESKLMKQTGVSRSPIREAFRILEGEGLIERISQKGVFVRGISLKEIRETYAILAVLEALAAEQATANLSEEDLRELAVMCDKMEECARTKDIKLWGELNYSFHKIFIKAAQNDLLEKALKNFRSKTTWFLSAGLHAKEAFEASLTEHRAVLEAFTKKDAADAAETARKHIQAAGLKVEQAFEAANA